MPWNAISKGEVYIIDGDAMTRDALSNGLKEKGYEVISFADGASLLSYTRSRTPTCVFVEVSESDRSGFEVLKKIRAEGCPAPIFVTSTHRAIPMAVEAIRSGAVDFLVKPIALNEVIDRFDEAICEYSKGGLPQSLGLISLHLPGCEPLTNREREVLTRLAAGDTNKEAARHLGLSARTVEGYRASIMRKVGVSNATELLRRVYSQGC